MGIISDLVNAIMVLFGSNDTSREFKQSLDSGSRFLRWGIDSRRRKDFETAVVELKNCVDEYASTSYDIITKYKSLGQAYIGLMEIDRAGLFSQLKEVDSNHESDAKLINEIDEINKKLNEVNNIIEVAKAGKTSELKRLLDSPLAKIRPDEVVLDKTKEKDLLVEDLQKKQMSKTTKKDAVNQIKEDVTSGLIEKKIAVEDVIQRLSSIPGADSGKDQAYCDTAKQELEEKMSQTLKDLKRAGIDIADVRDSFSEENTDSEDEDAEEE